ncbi:MAG: metallophosphoesterase [Actinobacteria bacterium]|nr:metallophosphoesterase [Actinomycetota bacterium]
MDILIIIISVLAAAAAAAFFWYAFRFETVNFKLSEVNINIKGDKDNNFCGKSATFLKVLHLSDFHLRKDRKGFKLFTFIKSLERLKPDIIMLTGDLVEKDKYFDFLTEMLSGLNATIGKYAVFGVHDYYHKRPKEFVKNMIKRQKLYRRHNSIDALIEKLKKIGIVSLRNEKVTINLSDYPDKAGSYNKKIDKIEIIGVDDAVIKKADTGLAFGGKGAKSKPIVSGSNRGHYREVLKPSTGGIHSLCENGKLTICITHTPDMDLFVDFVKNKTDIVLSGHTHGGQVRIPAVGALISGANIPVKYASGLFYFEKFVLYISRGLGEGRYSPFRIYCQPEATLININTVF